jgi:hypothetical protein
MSYSKQLLEDIIEAYKAGVPPVDISRNFAVSFDIVANAIEDHEEIIDYLVEYNRILEEVGE